MVIKHILIAHDLRSTADLALRRATQLARQHHARLTLLHVIESNQPAAVQEKAEQALDSSLTRFAPRGSELHIQIGRPADVILNQIQDLQADLLVLGAHHERHEFFSGTTLDRIARGCHIPLLLASIDDDAPYQRALAALNFSLCACNAFGHAYRLLPAAAELHALHVFETPKGSPAEVEALLATQRMLIEQLLLDETRNLPAKGPTLSHELQPGTLPHTLHEAIGKYRPQLLVLGSHGRSALSQALLGCLTQHFLHKAPCDVLMVR
ncbi:universal stress protein [Pseudomonas cavernicola]|uniref:Universal stress protein n=1 Tax=Pseudomonas cavernicola TaxID=2320866 RepID=A0A418XL04_9PSED|nr:universal stress protein [Pseudomonas cavernicola]RJG13168.1 universal stress protein [Pseudomonas cavernicola]